MEVRELKLLIECIQLLDQFHMMQIGRLPIAQDSSELNLYDDLSEFIKIFNKILNQIDSITYLLIRGEDCELQIKHLRETLLSHNQLIESYHFELDQISAHRNTYYRFMSRLIENVISFKKRGSSSHPIAASLGQFLARTEKFINLHKEEGNIGKMFRKIFTFVIKFCKECQMMIHKATPDDLNSTTIQKEEEQQRPKEESNKIPYIQSQTNFHKIIVGLNRRFATVSCLDVDYASFKSDFFQSRTQSNELFNQIFERNRFILRQITKYSKDFQQFLKRKQKSFLVRKNRFSKARASLGDNFTNSEGNSNLKKSTVSIETKYNQKNETQTSLLFNRIKQQHSRNKDEYESTSLQKQIYIDCKGIQIDKINPRKTSYQLKNVYISLNNSHHYIAPRPPQINYINDPLINQEKLKINTRKIQSLRSNKFTECFEGGLKPMPQTKMCEVKNIEFGNSYGQNSEVKGSFFAKFNNSKKYISQRKNIRIAQYTKSLNSSNIKQEDRYSKQGAARIPKN